MTSRHSQSVVVVSARSQISGEVLFEPKALPRKTAVLELRRTLRHRQRALTNDFFRVCLFLDGREIDDNFVNEYDRGKHPSQGFCTSLAQTSCGQQGQHASSMPLETIECSVVISQEPEGILSYQERQRLCTLLNQAYCPSLLQWEDCVFDSFCGFSEVARADRTVVTTAVGLSDAALEWADDALWADQDVMLAALARSSNALKWACDSLKRNPRFAAAAIARCSAQTLPMVLEQLPMSVRGNKDLIMVAVKRNAHAILFASEELRADTSVMIPAVERDWSCLRYAAETIKKDPAVVMPACRRGHALQLASACLKADRSFVLEAVRFHGEALQYATELVRADREVVAAAIAQSGGAFQYASAELKGDRSLVLLAMQSCSGVLKHAHAGLKDDKDLVLAAMQQDPGSLQFVSERLRGDKDVIRAAAAGERWGAYSALSFASDTLKRNRDFVLALVHQDGSHLEFVSDDLKDDRSTVLAAVTQRGLALQHASAKLKADREVVLAALQRNGRAFRYVAEPLKRDPDVLCVALKSGEVSLQQLPAGHRADARLVLAAVEKCCYEFQFALGDARSDENVARAFLQSVDWESGFDDAQPKSHLGFLNLVAQRQEAWLKDQFHLDAESAKAVRSAALLSLGQVAKRRRQNA